MSPGLQRAREPFRFRNALTGFGLGLFAVGIYFYSINAVKQDKFDDIDEEAKALARTGTPSGAPSTNLSLSSTPTSTPQPPPIVLTKDDERRIMENAFAAATGIAESTGATSQQEDQNVLSPGPQRPARGVLRYIDRRYPKLLDPRSKTLVWGAPPIDDIGKMSSPKRL